MAGRATVTPASGSRNSTAWLTTQVDAWLQINNDLGILDADPGVEQRNAGMQVALPQIDGVAQIGAAHQAEADKAVLGQRAAQTQLVTQAGISADAHGIHQQGRVLRTADALALFTEAGGIQTGAGEQAVRVVTAVTHQSADEQW